jgi:hypothetical protein
MGRAGLEPATNGLTPHRSRWLPINPVFVCLISPAAPARDYPGGRARRPRLVAGQSLMRSAQIRVAARLFAVAAPRLHAGPGHTLPVGLPRCGVPAFAGTAPALARCTPRTPRVVQRPNVIGQSYPKHTPPQRNTHTIANRPSPPPPGRPRRPHPTISMQRNFPALTRPTIPTATGHGELRAAGFAALGSGANPQPHADPGHACACRMRFQCSRGKRKCTGERGEVILQPGNRLGVEPAVAGGELAGAAGRLSDGTLADGKLRGYKIGRLDQVRRQRGRCS